MESIIIKRSTDANIEASLGCLLVVALPVIGFLYAMLTANHKYDVIAYGIIIIAFLLPSFINFISTKIPLKAAMIISDDGLMLSPSKSIFDSFAFLRKFQARREKRLLWENIAGFGLVIYNKEYTMSPTDGTGSTTYTVPQHHLCIEGKTKKVEVIFSIHGLDKTPDEILLLCNQFLKEYGYVENGAHTDYKRQL
ncbi:hypothetical protein SAMN05518672_101795 [Chitinophaga sp. CF118]|uniref:hypothetical protein n=1 Tax=Chitinophaga sp. CF118 TaxID=1884367 RepID=UPI0008EECB85|nr:hypothetical protein [Chitinophaga sp. CF118]SFD15816.1 hypothetical protein SAMN05518672_101795 [Chitinophaga sp. CF118]